MGRRARRRQDVVKGMTGKYHYHLCRQDQSLYEDSCAEPAVDGLCYECRGVKRPLWLVHMLPYPCCAPDNLELVARVQTFATYRLAGEGVWALCKTCQRKQFYGSK